MDRITHSKAFRRLKHKTQVFLQPEGDHYRTRLTHTLEVSRLARTVSRALGFSEDLTEAISLGHDLGHTPFGHAGERALREIHPGGFEHYEQSLRVVDKLERSGRGLNLCYETRMGILNHTVGSDYDSCEARVVRMCDRVAYINHDLDDAERAGIILPSDVPGFIGEKLGARKSERIDRFIRDIVANSRDGEVAMSEEIAEVFSAFHDYMHAALYQNPVAKREESKVNGVLHGIYEYYVNHSGKLPEDYRGVAETEGIDRAVCDYVSGMTDGYAMDIYGGLFIPEAWSVK